MCNSIVIITTLFPYSINDRNNSRVLLDFAKEWKWIGVDVNIIRHVVVKKIIHKYAIRQEIIESIKVYTIESSYYSIKSRSKFKNLLKIILFNAIIPLKKKHEGNTLESVLRVINPSHIITHMPKSLIFASDIIRRLNILHIHGFHQSDIHYLSDIEYIRKLKKVNKIAYRSYAIQNIVKKRIILPQISFVALSGVDTWLMDDINITINKWTTGNKIVLLTVCRAIKLKNIDSVIIALSEINTNTDWEYLIVGDGPELDYWKKIIEKYHMVDKIHLLGWLDRIDYLDLMSKSHFFIMPSFPETLGVVYLEAMAKCMVCIGTIGWGIDGVVVNNKNGYLVSPSNMNELSKYLHIILNNCWYSQNHRILSDSINTIKKLTIKSTSQRYLNFILN